MKNSFPFWCFCSLCFFLFSCNSKKSTESYSLGKIIYPNDNQLNESKIKLGEKLFFDKRLSVNNSISCSSCHNPTLAFTDGKELSDGVFGNSTSSLTKKTMRNAPSILNSAYLKRLMYDAEIKTLEMQAIVPIQDQNEMGIKMGDLIRKLRKIPAYQKASRKIFKRDFDAYVLTRSLANYERSLISDNSKFDQFYYKKQQDKLSIKAQKGFQIFSKKLYCTQCHALPYFTTFKAENNGYTSLNSSDLGRFRIHGDSSDIGKFKVPSLRNVALTAPYMHDGKLKTLEEVIDFYANGGRNVYNQSEIVKAFSLSKKEKFELIAFLKSLTDVE